MASKVSQHLLNKTVCFQTPQQTQFLAEVLYIEFTAQDEKILECRAALQVEFSDYQNIEQQQWFNLTPEVRNPVYGGSLNPDKSVELEIALHPELISDLVSVAGDVRSAAKYINELSESQTPSLFLESENWYILYVKQVLDLPEELATEGSSLKVGYSTAYADQLGGNEEEAEASSSGYMIDLATELFFEKGWEFSQIQGRDVLKVIIDDEQQLWDCYVQFQEEYNECSFYSVYPEKIAEEKRTKVMEFLTRANYGLPVGNFEINLDTGEIRCKTSLDAGEDKLSISLLNRLIEVNFELMTRYVPGIFGVSEEDANPQDAILQVESGD